MLDPPVAQSEIEGEAPAGEPGRAPDKLAVQLQQLLPLLLQLRLQAAITQPQAPGFGGLHRNTQGCTLESHLVFLQGGAAALIGFAVLGLGPDGDGGRGPGSLGNNSGNQQSDTGGSRARHSSCIRSERSAAD